jgi:hypothetical protein
MPPFGDVLGMIDLDSLINTTDTVLLDLLYDTFPTPDKVFEIISDFDDPTVKSHVTIDNKYPFGMTFYAVFAPEGGWIGQVAPDYLYNLIKDEKIPSPYISIFGPKGLPMVASADTSADIPDLGGLIVGYQTISYRWLARTTWGDLKMISSSGGEVDTRLKISVSGVVKPESLLERFNPGLL